MLEFYETAFKAAGMCLNVCGCSYSGWYTVWLLQEHVLQQVLACEGSFAYLHAYLRVINFALIKIFTS